MIRHLSTFTLMMFIALGAIGGCDSGGSGDVTLPTLPPPPPIGPQECSNCPCDFFIVPMTVECWVTDFTPQFSDGGAFQDELPGWCILEGTEAMSVSPHDTCRIGQFRSDTCYAPDDFTSRLSPSEADSCRTCLGNYAAELNDSGVRVIGGPPYECVDN